ncbi:MAG: methyltransferase domain-containing protein [Myxococcales bacterium]|nr:methyltransferase domain-containing protein [Myxococcales bacterium]MCB9753784.1 methyltransferase domain-containing protein [Myxococcales bacterium]
MRDTWSPEQYHQFTRERRQPYEDLVALVEPRAGMRVVDLGCGTGELTRDLADRLEAASALGLDRSEAMLERARAHASERVAFRRVEIERHVFDAPLDLVFSNAALHWVDGHVQVLARAREALAPGGQLAVQVPDNFAQPTHTTAVALAQEPLFAAALGGELAGARVEQPETYARLLYHLGFREQRVRQQVYLHVMPGPESAIEWVKGSVLTWYRARLGEALYAEFEARYRERLLAQLGDERPFPLTYRRTLLWARL